MRKLILIAALFAFTPITPVLAASDYDMTVDVAKTSAKTFKMERTGPAKDFVQRTAIYLRFIPAKGNQIHPAFINTHNYLTCPDKGDKRWPLESVSRVDHDKSSGISIFAFFFTRPECDNATFHMEAVTAES